MATPTLSKGQWPFSPQSVPTCILWLDAADQSSYTAGGSISSWRNKGTAGGTATTTAGTVGSTTATINGIPVMSFGASAYMTAPSMTYTQPTRTAFYVINIGSAGSTRYILSGTVNIDTQLYSYYSGTYTDLQMDYTAHLNYQTTTPYPIFNTTSIVCGTTLSTNGGIFVNGLAQEPYATNTPLDYTTGTTTSQTIGATGGDSFVLGELMIFDGAITDTQRQQVEGYLAKKWAMSYLLPTTHPYYTINGYSATTTSNFASFIPTQIPTCTLWLDASDSSTVLITSTVTTTYQTVWRDKSPNKYAAIGRSDNGGAPPQYLSSGTGGFSFNSSSQQYFSLATLMQNIVSIFIVADRVPSVSSQMCYLSGGASNYGIFGGTSSFQNAVYSRPIKDATYSNLTGRIYPYGITSLDPVSTLKRNTSILFTSQSLLWTSNTPVSGSYRNVYTNRYNGSTIRNSTIYAVAGLNTGIGTGSFTTSSITIGKNNGGTNYLSTNIYEVILYNNPMSATQYQSVETYLANKWSIPNVSTFGNISSISSPLSITGCQLWLDGADSTTVSYSTVSVYSNVSQWNDKSGLGYNLVAGTGSTTYTRYGPGPSIYLSSSYMYVNKAVNLQQMSYFIACASQNPNVNTNYISVFTGVPNSGSNSQNSLDGFEFVMYEENIIPFYGTFLDNASTIPLLSNLAVTMPSESLGPKRASVSVYGLTATTGGFYTDQSLATGYGSNINSASRATTAQGFAIGARWNGSSYTNINVTNANIYEILVYTTPLTRSQIQQIQGYLFAKWGCLRAFAIDASDSTTINNFNMSTIWKDKSGNGNHAIATGTNAPVIYPYAPNYGVLFTGQPGSYMTIPTLSNANFLSNTPYTIFAACLPSAAYQPVTNSNLQSTKVIFGDDGGQFYYGYAYTSPTAVAQNQNISLYTSNYPFTGGLNNTVGANGLTVQIVAVSTIGTYSYPNGGTGTIGTGTVSILTNGMVTPVIGRTSGGGDPVNGVTSYFSGLIQEIIIYSSFLPYSSFHQVNTYLCNKWGATPSVNIPGLTSASAISTCQLWLDSKDPFISTVNVAIINDKSGYNFNVSQITPNYQPPLVSSKYLTLGTSSNYYMNIPTRLLNYGASGWSAHFVLIPNSLTNWIMARQYDTLFTVGATNYNNTAGPVFSMTNSFDSNLSITTSTVGSFNYTSQQYTSGLGYDTNYFTGPNVLSTSSPTVVILNMNTDGTIWSYVNGVLKIFNNNSNATTNTNYNIFDNQNPTNFTLGAWIKNGIFQNSGLTNFSLGELAIYPSGTGTWTAPGNGLGNCYANDTQVNYVMPQVLIQQLSLYLMNKWGISNNLQNSFGSSIPTPMFNPLDIPNVIQSNTVTWFDSADPTSIRLNGGDNTLSYWFPKPGYAAVNYTGAATGIYLSTFGVTQTGGNAVIGTTYIPYTQNNTIFLVGTPVPANNSQMYFMNTDALGATILGGYNTSYVCGYLPANAVPEPVFMGQTPTSPFVVSMVKTSGVSVVGNYNGQRVFSTADTTGDTATLWNCIGGADATTNVYNGNFYEIIFYNTVLTNPQIEQITNYLQNKWQIVQSQSPISPTSQVYSRPFQPVDISGCQLWLDAADLGTLYQNTAGTTRVTTAGQNIQYWADKSGNANNATSSETAMTYNTSGIGYPSIYFDGNQTNGLSANAIVANATYFFVVNMTQTSGAYVFSGHQGTTNLRQCFIVDNLLYLDYSGITGINGSVGMNTNTIVTRQDNSSTGILDGWQNGTSIGSASMGVTGETFTQLSLGVNYPSGYPSVLYMSEVIIYNSVLPTSQRQQIEAYLAWKWGLRNSLPTTHPGYVLPSYSVLFTPKSIGGMQLWLDASDLNTLFQNAAGTTPVTGSGQQVQYWADKSGVGNTGFATGTPTYTINSFNTNYPSIVLDGSSYFLGTLLNTGYTNTTFAVFSLDSSSGDQSRIVSFGATGVVDYVTGSLLPFYQQSTTPTIYFYQDTSFNGFTTSFNTPILGTALFDGTTDAIYSAGALQGTASQTLTGPFNIANYGIGSMAGDFGSIMTGNICEVIVFSTALNTGQRQQVEGYLAWKWGIQSTLPSTHAFAKFKP